MYLCNGNKNSNSTVKREADVLPINGMLLEIDQKSSGWLKLSSTFFSPQDVPDLHQNLIYTTSVHLLLQICRNLRCSNKYSHNVNGPDYHMFYIVSVCVCVYVYIYIITRYHLSFKERKSKQKDRIMSILKKTSGIYFHVEKMYILFLL